MRRALQAVPQLPAFDVENIESLCVAGEGAVAFETLATQCDEHQLPLPHHLVSELDRAASLLGVDPKYSTYLALDGPHS